MSHYPLRFFGPGLLIAPDGQPLSLRSRKQLALLVYLAVEHSIAHSRDSLMALFWPEDSTPNAQNNLRVTLSRLRETAAKLGYAEELLVVDRNNVQLQPAWVERADVNHFDQLLDSTRQHAHPARSQCPSCQTALQAAVELYQGSLLEGFGLEDCPAFEEWLFIQRERLHLLALEAYADLAIYAEAKGDLLTGRSYAQRQIEIDPLRESAYRQQMRILGKQGERSLSLAVFERCRLVLREELGLDPEAETLALHGQILNAGLPDSTEIALRERTDDGVLPRHNLPQQLTTFVGREKELAQLQQRLQAGQSRLITLAGPGGNGKTRLALQVALENLHLFAQGAYFVPLAGVQSAEAIPTAIMEALGMSFVAGNTAPRQQLFTLLAKRQLLLIIDNLEHLMQGVAFLLELLQAAPNVTLLVTTRQQLNCQAEDLFVLHGLATPTHVDLAQIGGHSQGQISQYDAVRLFCDRAYRVSKEFKLSEANVHYVVEICQRVDGVPLAIELVTTWLRDYDCADLAAALAQGQSLLTTTQQDLPARHRSMEAVFTHSWQLLSASEQRILSQLALCPGLFSIRAAMAISAASLLDLTHLHYKSLLRSAASGYYEFHPLIRGFALTYLESDQRAAVETQFVNYYANEVAAQTTNLQGSATQSTLQAFTRELDNIHQAWQWAAMRKLDEHLLQLLEGLSSYYVATGRNVEGRERFEALYTARFATLSLDGSATSQQLCLRLLDEIGRCLIWEGKVPIAQRWAEQSLAAAQDLANREYEARALDNLSNALHQQGKSQLARQKSEEALAIARTLNQPALVARILHILGAILAESGERGKAEPCLQEALRIQRQLGNRIVEQRVLLYLCRMRVEDNDYQGAQGYLASVTESLQLVGNRPVEARISNLRGFVEAMLGNYPTALEYHASSRQISREIHQPIQESHALHNLCAVNRKMGNLAAAEEYGQEALRIALVHDLSDAVNYARLHLGYLGLTSGDLENAAIEFELAAQGWQARQSSHLALEATVGLAAVLYQSGKLAKAAQLVEPFLPLLLDHAPEGVDEPFEIYLNCYQILHALHDPRANGLLAVAYRQLQSLASKISDLQLRHTFWQIPTHGKIRALWQEIEG
ncbi:MAG: BTAD domain-containing putative transcriptional regulator [Caldilineaceae bacterium]